MDGLDIDAAHKRRAGSHAESLTGRIRAFFAANPDEELTFADIAAKFDCTGDQARFAVASLRGEKSVESVHLVRSTKGRL